MTAKKTGPPCPYCNSPTEFIDSKRVYGRWYGWLLACTRYPQCDAYVGCHGESKNPLGRLANAELRAAKKAAHAAFDPLWRPLPTGPCANCGGPVYDGNTCCSDECGRAYVAWVCGNAATGRC